MIWKTTSKKSNDHTSTFNVLDPERYKQAIASGRTQLVDVRTAREYKSGYIANAINIDLFRPGHFKIEIEKLDKTKPVFLYCRSGQRSRKAAKKLVKWGFSEIYDLEGGILNWENSFR